MILLQLIQILLRIYGFLLIVVLFLSWIPGIAQSTIGHALYRITEPYLGLFRFIPPLQLGMMALDLSPILALLVFWGLVEPLVLTVVAWLLALPV